MKIPRLLYLFWLPVSKERRARFLLDRYRWLFSSFRVVLARLRFLLRLHFQFQNFSFIFKFILASIFTFRFQLPTTFLFQGKHLHFIFLPNLVSFLKIWIFSWFPISVLVSQTKALYHFAKLSHKRVNKRSDVPFSKTIHQNIQVRYPLDQILEFFRH